MMVVAFDPGLTGACAVLDHNGLRAVFDLPTMPIQGIGPKAMVKRKLDGRALWRELRKHCPAGEPPPAAVIEAVGTMGGQNNAVQTQGALLRTLGALETVAECMALPVSYANPQSWKRFFGLIDPSLTQSQRKANALVAARRLYPACADIGLAKHHNRAESILIGHWFLRNHE